MEAKIRIEFDGAAYEVTLTGEEVKWERVLEASLKLLKSHTQGVQEVDMVEHLIRVHGLRETFAKQLTKSLLEQQSQSSSDAGSSPSPQKKTTRQKRTPK